MRPFFVVWTGQAFSLLGSQLVQFALVWWLTETGSSAYDDPQHLAV
jgi:DHA3 family macrolide efflux protein-like MFS transporter